MNKSRIVNIINDKVYVNGVMQTFTVSVRRKQEIKNLLEQRVKK